MKILFVFGGLPHYYNKVLNKLNNLPGFEVGVIVPASKSKTIGSGVHESEDNIEFKLIRLEEYKTKYGKPFFRNFEETVLAEKPDYLVIGWPYHLGFLFNPFMMKRIKRGGTKIFTKEIPFSVPGYRESFDAFNNRSVASQKTELIYKSRLWFRIMKMMRKRLYSKVCDGALIYTDAGVDIFNSYGMPRNNITVIYNSPDTEDIFETIERVKASGNIIRKKNRLVHVGRLVDWKRVDHLIMATKILKDRFPDIELVIVGKGEEEQNLKNLVTELDLKDSVRFAGAIYDEASLTEVFLQSDVYVLAGMGGLSINEAMCHALPVVCSVCDGTEKHLVFDNVNGKYFKPDDVESLAAAIGDILADPVLKAHMGETSELIIREKINVNTIIQRYQKAFV